MCVRHIYGNVKGRHGKKTELKKLIWWLAWSYNEAEYKERLDRVFNYDSEVFEDVMKTNPTSWVRAFYKIGNFCEDVENNSTESFNSSIVQAREKPLVPMLETIARLAMVRIAARDVKATEHKHICTPYVIEYLQEEHNKAANLEKRSCSCMKWDITGIPCEHGYGVILQKKLEAQDFVCHWFRTSTWRKTYEEGIIPIRGARFWPSSSAPSVHPAPDPDQPGRKKKNAKEKRKKGVNESPVKKKAKTLKRIMHCGICGEANHNSRFHKKGQKDGTSQIKASQGPAAQEI
ncbi:uncharacterized protein LOC103841102 [Brassica rapa]|uniref:uncharacterized protein LOC103841102 n=1 Tax=Brassica campestris TaxID=3711 RepID=UPI00142E8D6C|nr:uncharacterized protein LOC103841102 [Brassica rapa]